MPSGLPQISGKELVKILTKNGFTVISQKGSHVKLRKISPDEVQPIVLIVPLHKALKRGTLSGILKRAKVEL